MLAPVILALATGALANPAVVQRQDPSPTTLSVTTATPSPTAALDQNLPSQAALPPQQAWCPSEIFCAGALLQTLNLAQVYPDSKTIVDKPTTKSSNETLAAYDAFGKDANSITYGEVVNFVQASFTGEGQELEALSADTLGYQENPEFLNKLQNPLTKGFAQSVHSYWRNLVRGTNESRVCDGDSCESSLIPLNHTFVVPGGRFREVYYWDSFFAAEGLLVSGLNEAVKSTLLNFMDYLDQFGFIPNGGRIYYLNRSQPPFFIPMLYNYVNATGDRDILTRALPLAEKELDWWKSNRSVEIKSPSSDRTHNVYRYAVGNSAPRPESYLPDYLTANGPDIETPYTDEEKALLYSNLASGAESGWDYSTRWFKNPYAGNATWAFPKLRSLNVREIIPVDLNSILYRAHADLARLYALRDNDDDADRHREAASDLRSAIIDLFWDADKFAFYDYNRTANARNAQLTAAHFYPLAFGIHPPALVKDSASAFKAFATVYLMGARYNGTYPATWIESGQQWDTPNAWAPHQWVVLSALHNLPANVSGGALPSPAQGQTSLDLIPAGQIGVTNDQLPRQILAGGAEAPLGDLSVANGQIVNGGVSSDGEGWAAALERVLANRYYASALCSWHATGGSLPNGVLDRLPDDQLNVTNSIGQAGHMYEKYSLVDMDSAGRGGEYTVQDGFGWTNGILLWVVDNYNSVLQNPTCPQVLASGSNTPSGGNNGPDGALTLSASVTTLVLALAAVSALLA